MKSLMRLLMLAMLVALLGFGLTGCGDDGSDGSNGKSAYEIAVENGFTGTEQEWLDSLNAAAEEVEPESCAVCHPTAGTDHQANYDDAMDTTLNLTFGTVTATPVGDGTFTTTVPFTITKGGVAVDSTVSGGKIAAFVQQRFGYAVYDATTGTFPTAAYFSTSGLTNDGGGAYHLTDTLDIDITATTTEVYSYVTQDPILNAGSYDGEDGHIQLYREVFNAGQKPGTPFTYTSAAAVSACEKCHGTPYLKHGYRGADATNLDSFGACKVCHYDTRAGHSSEEFFGDASYAYTADVMTDVHASHLNVFPYPQEMANCVTCHSGTKLTDETLIDENFTRAVCTSCHADVDATTNTTVALPLSAIKPFWHDSAAYTNCENCHSPAGASYSSTTTGFADVHPGYDMTKYASVADAEAGTLRYTYFVDGVTYDATASSLTITWGAKDAADAAVNVLNLDATAGPVFLGLPAERDNESEGIRILVGYYGWGTHNVAAYDQYRKDDVIANTTYDSTTGIATTTFPLTDKLATYDASKLEIGIIGVPEVDGTMVAVKSVTKGIVLADGSLVDRSGIVADAKCNACHDNIVIHTNSSHGHTAVGNVNSCLFCHNTSSAAHVTNQSRAIDSYLHDLHTFVEEPEFVYPMFSLQNCESCHVGATDAYNAPYNVPDQLAASGALIDAPDEPVTVGPGSKSCGSCHRANALKDGDLSGVAEINSHTKVFGYRVPESVMSFVDVMNAIFAKLAE